MEQVSAERLQKEIELGYKPLALRSGLSALPYTELSDRDFENLIYCLMRAETESIPSADFDDVALMQGVGEKGRDCVLYQNGRIVGAVQCKNLKVRMTRPAVIKELIKFLLFALLDNQIMPNPKGFKYHLYVPGGLTGPAISLVSGFAEEIEREVSNGDLLQHLVTVASEFESFECFVDKPPLDKICETLRGLNFKAFEGADINNRLSQNNGVLSSFFQVSLVVESDSLMQKLDEKWNTAGLNFLTDEALIALHARLNGVSENLRVGLGAVDLYGYSMDFVKFLGRGGFEELIRESTKLRNFLDLKLISYLSSKISDFVYEEITLPFINQNLILPFTASVIHQYLLKCALPKMMERSVSAQGMSRMHPTASLGPDELLRHVLEQNITSQIKVAQGDYSQFPDPDPDRAKRLYLFEALRAGCSVDVLEQRFWNDYRIIRRTIGSILSDVIAEFSALRTIVVKDSSFLNNPEEARKVLSALKDIDS
ncbi:hypothetical protein BK636_01295 [Pseudomonas chlororaphis]|uniref:hypothetical protein n=1 Tax=Pseudomonas chlororaphis TaxID=587753 RepID=UPI000F4887D2|nr:hypothetical protein [Pseudomonas chlororaphis]ROL94870.1 hypothetical protein BK636_01295 [Pseudomonas chlororaphis]